MFKGLGCFANPPQIIADDDYREKPLSLFEADVHIFVFNIDKFNKEDAKMKKINEMIGDSFYQFLSSLPDLVLIMDESHHYGMTFFQIISIMKGTFLFQKEKSQNI